MKIRLFAAALVATLSISSAQAQDILPRFEKLLKDVASHDHKGIACPHVMATVDQELSPMFMLRKDDKVETEFLTLTYYPSVNYLRLSARTAGERFGNKCLLGAVLVDVTTGELKRGGFSDCLSTTGLSIRVDEYKNTQKDKQATGVEFKLAWEKRAEEFISEAESSVALCKSAQ